MPTRGTDISPVPVLGTTPLHVQARPTRSAPPRVRLTHSRHALTRYDTIKNLFQKSADPFRRVARREKPRHSNKSAKTFGHSHFSPPVTECYTLLHLFFCNAKPA